MQRVLNAMLMLAVVLLVAACDKQKSPTAPSSTGCSITVSTPSFTNFPTGGGSTVLNVTSSGSCGALTATSSGSWLNVATEGNTVKVTALGNPTTVVRSATVTIGGTSQVNFTQDALVPTNCTYTAIFIPKANPDPVSKAGGNGAFSIGTQAGCPWAAASTVPWITLTNATSGNGSFSGATYQVSPNTTGSDRTGSIRVQNQELKLTQLGK